MKKAILLIFVMLVVANGQSALQDMVKTEQAFSKMAEEQNTRDAFLAFIADDGLLFRPGAVNGKKWLLESPVQLRTGKRRLLAWQPSYAVVAASGDMGFTTGPWEVTEINDEKPSRYGHFVTVWKKQADGSWKFVVDLGVSHLQSGGPQTLWTPAETSRKETFKPVPRARTLKSLQVRDEAYAVAASTQGSVKAFTDYASPDVRLYRENNLPFIGREASAAALAKTITQQVKWSLLGSDVSQAGDLGYTHGIYEGVNERGSYVRIWRKENGQWRIVMDVTNAHSLTN